MNEQFVLYELALELKKLGFNDECFGYYNKQGKLRYVNTIEEEHRNGGMLTDEMKNSSLNSSYCSAPLWQQAFEWFIKNHGLSGAYQARVLQSGEPSGYWTIMILDSDSVIKSHANFSENIEEAKLECLQKLIELCKKN